MNEVTVTTPTELEIRVERVFDAPRAHVYSVWTDPNLIPEWWGDGTVVEEMDVRERFDIVLAMEVIEHVIDVVAFLSRCAAMVKPGGMMVVSTLNRNWKSFALAIVGAEYVLRWLPRGTHQWDKFVTPDELAHHLHANNLGITEQAGVVY